MGKRIFVTGGAGFLGIHATRALLEDGHALRLLVRNVDKARAALSAVSVDADRVELVQGDVCDAAVVERGLKGCDAVLNAAARFSFDRRRDREVAAVDAGVKNVHQLAVAAGCDPIVPVSSVVTLYPATGRINASAPRGAGLRDAYVASKCATEAVATEMQQRGAPVVTTYPGSMWGPHDPGPGEMIHSMRGFLGNMYAFRMPSRAALPVTDVEWAARAHAAIFRGKVAARRITMTGHHAPWSELFDAFRSITGKRLPLIFPSPAPMALATGRLLDVLQRVLPFRLPLSYQQTWTLLNSAPTDDAVACALAGPPPALEVTLRRAIEWAVNAGHVSPNVMTKRAAQARLTVRT
jgi:dihydroflavonol-4-reductase